MNMKSILYAHALRYPKMQPQDTIKLIYQHTFGPGHMIANPVQSLDRLCEEVISLKKEMSIPLFEDIGNGLVRLHLAAVDLNVYSLERINNAFVLTAGNVHGDIASFEKKLLGIASEFNAFPFDFTKETYLAYLNSYREKGFPAVSHSETYRQAYNPSYRVIYKEFLL